MNDRTGSKAPRTGNWLLRTSASLTAIGVLALGACTASSHAEKGPEPTQPTASAPATPGEASPSVETTPSASETPSTSETETSAEYKLDLSESTIYNSLSTKEQAEMDRLMGLSVEAFLESSDPDKAVQLAYMLVEIGGNVAEAHYVATNELSDQDDVDYYTGTRFDSFKDTDPKKIDPKDNGIGDSINELMTTSSAYMLAASQESDGPKKQALHDAAYKILIGSVNRFQVTDDYWGISLEAKPFYLDFTKRLDGIYDGDRTQLYDPYSSTGGKTLPLGLVDESRVWQDADGVYRYAVSTSQGNTYAGNEIFTYKHRMTKDGIGYWQIQGPEKGKLKSE